VAGNSEFPPQRTTSAVYPVLAEESALLPAAAPVIGYYLEKAELLGKRTAQMHLALASNPGDEAFAPEPFTASFQRDATNAASQLTRRNFDLLRQKLEGLSAESRGRAAAILDRETDLLEKLHRLPPAEKMGMRLRIHGDYHLGQVLYTGSDFVIIDFEGEPARPLAERRVKRSPLQDAAGMLRSFHYAAFAHLLGGGAALPPAAVEGSERFSRWAERWYSWVVARFLSSYLEAAQSGSFLPPSRDEVAAVLQVHLLEKAVYELGYELNNRPAWAGIPLAGILQLLPG
jgi:maltose alpha-D-glucosyltransferase/alpha-amylase